MDRQREIMEEITAELASALEQHGDFHSYHEGYAVILEEMDELWNEIKKKEPNRHNMIKEARQVAAMAIKFIGFVEGTY